MDREAGDVTSPVGPPGYERRMLATLNDYTLGVMAYVAALDVPDGLTVKVNASSQVSIGNPGSGHWLAVRMGQGCWMPESGSLWHDGLEPWGFLRDAVAWVAEQSGE